MRDPRRDSIQLILRICGAIPQRIIPVRAQVLMRDEAFAFTTPPKRRGACRACFGSSAHIINKGERPAGPIGGPEPACTRRPIHYQVEVADLALDLALDLGFEDI